MTLRAGIRLHGDDFAPGEAALIAGIWRRAWAAAHPDIALLEPIGHWLARVQTEFKPPHELLVAERNSLVQGLVDRQPGTGRERMAYHRPAPTPPPGPP